MRRSARRDLRRFLVEGPAAVGAGLAAHALTEVFATAVAAQRHADLLEEAARQGLRVHRVDEPAAAALSETVTPQGLVGVAPLPEADLSAVLRTGAPLLVAVLVEPRDPGNAGTVIRSADAVGADAVVLVGDSVDPWGGKCVRASAGSVFHLPVIDGVPVEAALRALRAAGLWLLAADGRADHDLDEVTDAGALARPTAWLFGNEAHGLPPAVVHQADLSVRVPVYGRAESLNLAAAAVVCLYASARALRGRRIGRAGGAAQGEPVSEVESATALSAPRTQPAARGAGRPAPQPGRPAPEPGRSGEPDDRDVEVRA